MYAEVSDVVLIDGSPSAGWRSTAAASYLVGLAESAGYRTSAIYVRDLRAAELLGRRSRSEALDDARGHVAGASAVIIATPVYKAAHRGLLETFFDALEPAALAGKVVLPVATAATNSHSLSTDDALRPVLAALGAEYVLPGVFLLDAQIPRDVKGGLSFRDGAATELHRAAKHLLGALRLMGAHASPQEPCPMALGFWRPAARPRK
jgi:FMN reductase